MVNVYLPICIIHVIVVVYLAALAISALALNFVIVFQPRVMIISKDILYH